MASDGPGLGPWSNPAPPDPSEPLPSDEGVEPVFVLSLLRALLPPQTTDQAAPPSGAPAGAGDNGAAYEAALELADRARIDATCVLWDLTVSERRAHFCHEHHLLPLLLWPLARPAHHSDRLLEVSAGTLANLASVPSVRHDMLEREDLGQAVVALALATPSAEVLSELLRLTSALLTSADGDGDGEADLGAPSLSTPGPVSAAGGGDNDGTTAEGPTRARPLAHTNAGPSNPGPPPGGPSEPAGESPKPTPLRVGAGGRSAVRGAAPRERGLSAAQRWLRAHVADADGLVDKLCFVLERSPVPLLVARAAAALESLLFHAQEQMLPLLCGARRVQRCGEESAAAAEGAPAAAAAAAADEGVPAAAQHEPAAAADAEKTSTHLCRVLVRRLFPGHAAGSDARQDGTGPRAEASLQPASVDLCLRGEPACALLSLTTQAMASARPFQRRAASGLSGPAAAAGVLAHEPEGEWGAISRGLSLREEPLWTQLALALSAPWAAAAAQGGLDAAMDGAAFACADDERLSLCVCALLAAHAALISDEGGPSAEDSAPQAGRGVPPGPHGGSEQPRPAGHPISEAGAPVVHALCELLRLAVQRARDLPVAGPELMEEAAAMLPVWRCLALMADRLDGIELAISAAPWEAGGSALDALLPLAPGCAATRAERWAQVQHGVFAAFVAQGQTLSSAHGLMRRAAACACEEAREAEADAQARWCRDAALDAEGASARLLDGVLTVGDVFRAAGDTGGRIAEAMALLRGAADAELDDAWPWHTEVRLKAPERT